MIINTHKKREGSTILLILIISMVIVIMGGAITSAMLFTMRANKFVKIEDDLFYAAEGGSELGMALVRKDILYGNSKNPITNPGIQADINMRAIKLQTDRIHSVDITTELDGTSGKQVKIISTAYGRQSDGSKDFNKKKTISKIIKKGNNGSGDIFKNSIVSEGKIDIEIFGEAGLDMDTTNITAGEEIKLPSVSAGPLLPIRTFPIEHNDVFEAAIFKPNVKLNPKVEVNFAAGINHRIGLIDKAIPLDLNGGTMVPNGVGKFRVGNYDIILVNAIELVIDSSPNGLNEYRTIVISSGDITFKLGESASIIKNSNFFGKNVTFRTPSSLNINEAPLQSTTPIPGNVTYFLSDTDLIEIDRVISNYVINWKTSTLESGGDSKWNEVESETIYE